MNPILINFSETEKIWEFLIEVNDEIEIIELNESQFKDQILSKGIKYLKFKDDYEKNPPFI